MLNEAQRLFKALLKTGLCPYVAEQAVRNHEVYMLGRKCKAFTGSMHGVMGLFIWADTPQGYSFWSKQRDIQQGGS